MRALSLLRRRFYWIAGVLIGFIVLYKLIQSRNSVHDREIPVLRKTFIRKGKNVLFGPFKGNAASGTTDHGITFATHTSLHNLYRIQILSLAWKSPVSVAIWAYGDLNPVIELCYILTLSCSDYAFISLSVLVPTDQVYSIDTSAIDWSTILSPGKHTCSQRELHNRLYALRASDSSQNYAARSHIPYPNNKLRNIALASVETNYVLSADIDILPSMLTDDWVMKYLHQQPLEPYTALVVPVFESQDVKINQWNMERLLHEFNQAKARPFYVETCPQCQGPTQYDKWLERQLKSEKSFYHPEIVVYKPGWEPFVILKTSNHPEFDERFEQFGYNRMSMVCELHLLGYKFVVLDKVFLMHDGFKVEEGFHAEKDEELKRNEAIYQTFRVELAQKYRTSRTC